MIINLYYSLVFLMVAGFAVYDIYKKRVPNKALVFCIPAALLAPIVNTLANNAGGFDLAIFADFFLTALLGAAVGFIIMLGAAMASKDGNGVGGGDIKLSGLMGFIYGPYGMILILLAASLLAMPVGLIRKRASKDKTLRLAFVPFLAAGSLAVMIALLII